MTQPAFSQPVDVAAAFGVEHGIVTVDPVGRVRVANPAAATLLGVDDMIGRPLCDVADGAVEPLAFWRRLTEADLAGRVRIGGRAFVARSSATADGGRLIEFKAADPASSTDALTGLSDRRGLSEALDAALRDGSAFALVCLDLDRFKIVNDTLGHPVGDGLLRKVADRLRTAVRPGDLVARTGGDEFIVLQREGRQPQAAEALAGRLVELLGRTFLVDGHSLTVGASVGVAMAPRDGNDARDLLRRADLALYRAKAAGRGAFRTFEPFMDVELQARRALELDLRRAIALKTFTLDYQPKISLRDGRLAGFEALLRWERPGVGPTSPAEFVPLAEETGLIVPLGAWVLQAACREAANWPDDIAVSVNVSAVQFRRGGLVEAVRDALRSSRLAPERLEIEITETALLEDTDQVLRTLHALRALGVRVSMDDFGAGYSSLSHLQRFPFHRIKIDRSFVQGMREDGDDCTAIVRAVAALGASLGAVTTAEGVETEDQLRRVEAEGCQEVQGYLTGRPQPAESVRALIAARRPQEGAA